MVEIIVTKDGSHSLLNKELNETYHSVHGALQESRHVFIKNGLEHALKKNQNTISIFEVGFGTGLNALLTLQMFHPAAGGKVQELNNNIHYISLEAFPIDEHVWTNLNYPQSLGLRDYFEQLHTCAWGIEHAILPNFMFRKINTTLQLVHLPDSGFDLIYFDAFAPNKQPEMWTLPVLKKLVDSMKPGGTFVTYCAKGQLKRDLQSLSMDVETLPGPPGKKEMVRATRLGGI